MRQICIYLAASGSHSKPSQPFPFLGNLTCNTVQDQWGQKCLLLPRPWPALAQISHLATSSPRSTRQIPGHSPKAPHPGHPRAHRFPNIARDLPGLPRPSLDSGGGPPRLPKTVCLTPGVRGEMEAERRCPAQSACMRHCPRRPWCSDRKAHEVCPWAWGAQVR